jgi:protein-S-isoprenylcysteine O-methyltransferase Ste14
MKVIKPPYIFFILVVVFGFLHFYYPIKQLIYFPYTLFGILILILGLCIDIWAIASFKWQGTPIYFTRPRMLIDRGPYKYSRNPMYIGVIGILLGVSILLGSLISFLAPILFFIYVKIFIIPWEEKMLRENFGKYYGEYRGKVREWC